MSEVKKERDPYKMRPSQLIGWSGRAISVSVNFVVLGYITFFCTNILALPATLVGTLLMASKIFDGVTDLCAGFLIDKTHTRFGKARPYEFCILGVWVMTIVLFCCPDMGTIGKAIWVFVTYTFINSIFVTLLSASEPVYMGRAFRYESDRTKLASVNGLLVTLFCTVISIVFPILMGTLGTTRGGWSTMVLITAIPFMIIGMGRFFLVKETNVVQQGKEAEKLVLKDFAQVFKDKYIFIIAGVTIIMGLLTNCISAVQTYYFTYVVGDIKMLSTIGMIGMFTPFILLLMPKVLEKISITRLFIVASGLGIVACVLRGFAGGNMPVLLVSSLLQGIAGMPSSYYTMLLIIDIIDYNEWKNGARVEGVVGAINGFAGKLAGGLAAGMVGIIMGVCGFDGTLATQSASAMASIKGLYSWAPAVMFGIVIFIMLFFDLEKKMPQIKADLQKKREKQ